jgi:hypothetical protein
MSKCTEIRQRLVGLRTEAATLLDKADKEADGVLSAEQADRMDAITAERTELETELDAEIAALEGEAANASAEFDRGIAAGWAGAVAAVEVCAVANVPATRVLGFVQEKASAEDVRKAVLAERASSDEINHRNSGRQPGRVKEGASSPLPKASDVYAKRAAARQG